MFVFPTGRTPSRRASVATLAAFSMIPIMLLTALAVDSTFTMSTRRHDQNCCDAAALAGCIQLSSLQSQGSTPTLSAIQAAVYKAASQNNLNNGTNCTIAVNWPPVSGNFQNTSSVEVLLTFTRNNLVVRGSNTVTVRSVASCSTGSVPSFPMLMLDSAGADAFWTNSGKLTLGTPTVQVNSTNANAAVVSGMSGSVANVAVHAVGGSSGTFSPAVTYGGSPLADPYANVPTPTTKDMTVYSQSDFSGSGNVTLNPGYYPNGLYISSGNVTLNPGLYYIEGGNCWINTPGTVTGNGVTLYHNGPSASARLETSYDLNVGFCFCPTNNNYTFNPPTSGTYAGISLFQNRTSTAEAFYDFWGTGTINCGLQYFPNATLRCWSASGGGTINCNELVCKDFKLTGSHEIYGNSQNGGFSKLTWNATRTSNRPLSGVYLAE